MFPSPVQSPGPPPEVLQPLLPKSAGTTGFFTALGAVAAIGLILAFIGLVIATSLVALWHSHLLVNTLVFTDEARWRSALTASVIGLEFLACGLLFRQLLSATPPPEARQELLSGDQPHLFALIHALCKHLKAKPPTKVIVDTSANCRARPQTLHIGLSMLVGLSLPQLAGILTHELSFLAPGRGARALRVMVAVHQWFVMRIQHDPLLRNRKKHIRPSLMRKLLRWPLRGAVYLASLPMRLLHGVLRLLLRAVARLQVSVSDQTAMALVGSTTFTEALAARTRLGMIWQECEALYQKPEDPLAVTEVPDNIPLLVGRWFRSREPQMIVSDMKQHWLPQAPNDVHRLDRAHELTIPSQWTAEGPGTQCIISFHEQSRRATHFHYQNAWGFNLSQIKLVNVDESVHTNRQSNELVTTMNRYLRGMAHPERAFCGIAKESHGGITDQHLLSEMKECRGWLAKYSDRTSTALAEWSHAWRLVRDIEGALALSAAGLPIHRQQFASSTAEGLREELHRQQEVMNNLEGMLKESEGKLETLMACSLELMWRADPATLPAKLQAMRETLPHWVMIYETLGLSLPTLRSLITTYHAFNALGAEISGRVESAAYFTTVKTLLPLILNYLARLGGSMKSWPYPFTGLEGKRISMSEHLGMTEAAAAELSRHCSDALNKTDHKLAGQTIGRILLDHVSPFIDRYLELYHQSFAWVTKATQLSEWHFVDPVKAMAERVAASTEEPAEPALAA
jgi:hypothetical protein